VLRRLVFGLALLRAIFWPPKPEIDPEDPDNWLGLEYLEEQVATQLKQQYGIWDAVDARLRLILGVISLVFAVSVGFQRSQGSLSLQVGFYAILAIIIYILAAALVALAYWPRDFDWPPNPAGLRGLIMNDPRETKLAVVDSIIAAYNLNGRVIEFKVAVFKWAFLLTAVATTCLSIAIGHSIWGQTTGMGAPPPTPQPTGTAPVAVPFGGANESASTQEPSRFQSIESGGGGGAQPEVPPP
jgi:hypothetical protein